LKLLLKIFFYVERSFILSLPWDKSTVLILEVIRQEVCPFFLSFVISCVRKTEGFSWSVSSGF